MHLWSKAESAQAFKYNQSINALHIQRKKNGRRNKSTYWTFCCTSLSWYPHSRSLHLWLLILHNSQTKKKKEKEFTNLPLTPVIWNSESYLDSGCNRKPTSSHRHHPFGFSSLTSSPSLPKFTTTTTSLPHSPPHNSLHSKFHTFFLLLNLTSNPLRPSFFNLLKHHSPLHNFQNVPLLHFQFHLTEP